MKDESTREKGIKGEESAVAFLLSQGYSILEKNYRYSRYGEIDIIARKELTTVFVEVRSKNEYSSISALDSVTPGKLGKVKKAASAYVHSHQELGEDEMFRFDVITIEAGEISWYQDVLR